MKNNRKLLIVDDEENIVRALNRLFRRDGYQLFLANSGQQGLDILKENNIGVIISDQRMPEMTGVEFLSQAKLLHPDSIRIVLSGYTDLKSITDAINEGSIYKFLTKPWDDDLLRENVTEAFERYELKSENFRLSQELKLVISSLEKANQKLNINVEKKSEQADFNMHVLNIAQEVLENMPAGIIGIDTNGMIAFTNKLTEEWFDNDGRPMIGSMANHSLPNAMLQKALAINENQHVTVTLPNSLQLNVHCRKLQNSLIPGGTVLVLTKTA